MTEFRAETVKAIRINGYPGDTRMKLTADAKTVGDDIIKRGTIFQPSSAGRNNVLNIDVRRVSILAKA